MAAPTRVGGNSTSYATRTNTAVTVSGYTIQADDIILYKLVTAAAGEAPNPTVSGSTEIGTAIDTADDGFNLEDRLYYKRAAGGETSVAATHASCSSQGVVEVWRGVDWSTGPLDATQTQADGAGTTATAPGLTTATADAKLLFFGSDWADTTNNLSPPSGMTEHLDITLSYVASETRSTPGATGNRSHTVNNVGAFHRWTARMIALRPLADAATEHEATGAGSMPEFTAAGEAVLSRIATAAGLMPAFTGAALAGQIFEASGGGVILPFTGAGEATLTRKATAAGLMAAFTAEGLAAVGRHATAVGLMPAFTGAGDAQVIHVTTAAGVLPIMVGEAAAAVAREAVAAGVMPLFIGEGEAGIPGLVVAEGVMPAMTGAGAVVLTRVATAAGVMPVFIGRARPPDAVLAVRFGAPFRGGFRGISRRFRGRP